MKLTPPALAREYGVSVDKVLAWIRSGELRAVNVATRPAGRPRWRIDPDDVAAFEARRTMHSHPRATRRRKRPAAVTEYF